VAVIGKLPEGDVVLNTFCRATYGKDVYDVTVNGRRFQLDFDPKMTTEQRVEKIGEAYRAQVAADAMAALMPAMVQIEVPAEDADAIREIVQSKGTGKLVVVPVDDVTAVDKASDKAVVVKR
jgi:hypothetical protein